MPCCAMMGLYVDILKVSFAITLPLLTVGQTSESRLRPNVCIQRGNQQTKHWRSMFVVAKIDLTGKQSLTEWALCQTYSVLMDLDLNLWQPPTQIYYLHSTLKHENRRSYFSGRERLWVSFGIFFLHSFYWPSLRYHTVWEYTERRRVQSESIADSSRCPYRTSCDIWVVNNNVRFTFRSERIHSQRGGPDRRRTVDSRLDKSGDRYCCRAICYKGKTPRAATSVHVEASRQFDYQQTNGEACSHSLN